MNIPIVMDYAAIAERLLELAVERQSAQFTVPSNVMLLLRSAVRDDTVLPTYPLCLVLDESTSRLVLLAQVSTENLTTAAGTAFIQHLHQFFPSACLVGRYEILLSLMHTRQLAGYLRKAIA